MLSLLPVAFSNFGAKSSSALDPDGAVDLDLGTGGGLRHHTDRKDHECTNGSGHFVSPNDIGKHYMPNSGYIQSGPRDE